MPLAGAAIVSTTWRAFVARAGEAIVPPLEGAAVSRGRSAIVAAAFVALSSCAIVSGCGLVDRRGEPSAAGRILGHLGEAAREAGGEIEGPIGAALALGGGTLVALFGVRRGREASARAAAVEAEAEKDRTALAITMGALETAPHEARQAARDAARQKGVSDHLERMIANGWVMDVSHEEKPS